LVEERIVSLQDVTPQTITKFLVEVQKSNRGMATATISNISTFFNWMIGEGRRKAANPVVGMIHYNRKKQRLPRPYEENELNFIWQLLRERGNSRVRLAAAIAEEAGLRIGEICRLRISDVDMVQQRIAVGLPNKSNRERAGFFSHKTSQYCDEWMRERNPDCGHDFLIYNFYGNPYSPTTLAEALKRVLCKTLRGKRIHETGLDKWSMHRLRHNMATNLVSGGADAATVMAAGGWLDPNSMAGYAKVNEPVTRRGYDEAMRRVQYQKQSVPRTIVLTPAELLMRRQVTSVKAELSEVNERCV
jgi:integrase/recombinase XerC